MIESSEAGARPGTTVGTEDKSLRDILAALVGQTVTMVNPESYEVLPVGHRLQVGFYKAKLVAVGKDYVTVVTTLTRPSKKEKDDPVKQFIPLGKIKRISLMEKERLIHL